VNATHHEEVDEMTETPIACTLGANDLAALAQRWRTIRREAGLGRQTTREGLRLEFRAAAGVEDELRALVAVESECCAWATWNVERQAERLSVVVASSGEGVVVLHGMFA
jgi:hypothetical protein